MLLPTKHIKPENAIIGVGAEILSLLQQEKSVSVLLRDLQNARRELGLAAIQFDWFLLSLDFLFAIKAIDYQSGIVSKVQS